MSSVTSFCPCIEDIVRKKKCDATAKGWKFYFFSAPDLNVHLTSISYVKCCVALWKQGNTSIIGRGKSKVHYSALIEATHEVLTSEVSSIFYVSCLSSKHIVLWETVICLAAYFCVDDDIFQDLKRQSDNLLYEGFKPCARTRTKSLRELLQLLIVLSLFNRYKEAPA